MARRWKRRTIIIALIVVALSVGLVFTTIAYYPHPPAPHGSIQAAKSHTVGPGTQSMPGFFGLTIPGIIVNEPFALGVSSNGTAVFCVLLKSTYENWAFNLSSMRDTFPFPSCIYGPTGQISQSTLQFAITPGDWVVAALNYYATTLNVTFSPA